jgi:hypothetical protein
MEINVNTINTHINNMSLHDDEFDDDVEDGSEYYYDEEGNANTESGKDFEALEEEDRLNEYYSQDDTIDEEE